jgi:hypothetical protein
VGHHPSTDAAALPHYPILIYLRKSAICTRPLSCSRRPSAHEHSCRKAVGVWSGFQPRSRMLGHPQPGHAAWWFRRWSHAPPPRLAAAGGGATGGGRAPAVQQQAAWLRPVVTGCIACICILQIAVAYFKLAASKLTAPSSCRCSLAPSHSAAWALALMATLGTPPPYTLHCRLCPHPVWTGPRCSPSPATCVCIDVCVCSPSPSWVPRAPSAHRRWTSLQSSLTSSSWWRCQPAPMWSC